jgi:1-acyl-sn-glycerol-3-phosphate acyltransferase
MSKMGEVRATYQNAITVLERNELVGIYPAGERAMGQPRSSRYMVGEFRSGCVRAALETKSPIIPVITIGNGETYPMLWNAKFLANLFQVPYFGISPQFPLLPFPASAIPFPVKWLIHVGKPILLEHPPEAALNRELVNEITLDLQNFFQNELDELLAMRKSYMRGWDVAEVESWIKGRQHEFAQRT